MKNIPLRTAVGVLGVAASLGLSKSVLAEAIPIFNTGVDGSGRPLASGSVDSHYTWAPGGGNPGNFLTFYDPNAAYTNRAVVPTGFLWGANNAQTQAISFSQATTSGYVPFTYRTTFDLSGLNAATASINLTYYADDLGEIALNGALLPSTYNAGNYATFAIPGGFIDGVNTLDFVTFNEGGPGGLFVQVNDATADAPEPASLALLGAGLAGIGLIRRRKQA